MAKKMKQIYRWPLFSTVGVLSVFMVLGITAAAYGVQQYNARQEIIDKAAEKVASGLSAEGTVAGNPGDVTEEEVALGATFTEDQSKASTSTTELSHQANISLFDRFRWGDTGGSAGVTLKFKILEKQNATNTVHFLTFHEGDSDNRSVWIDRRHLAVQILGAPSIATNFCVGTSTQVFVNTSLSFINSTITPAGTCGLLQPGVTLTSTNAPTSTVLHAADWPGTATQDWIEIKQGVSITAYATSTGVTGVNSVTTTASLFKTRLFVPYVIYD